MLSPPKTNTLPSPSTVAVGYQRATLMSAAFDHVFVDESKIVASLIPTSAATFPPTIRVRPSGSRMWPAQKRFAPYGTATNVPVDGFQIRWEFGASPQASIGEHVPGRQERPCAPRRAARPPAQTTGRPGRAGARPARPRRPRPRAARRCRTRPSTRSSAARVRPVVALVSAVPAPPRSRKRSAPAPFGLRIAIQYAAPAVIGTDAMLTSFQFPATGEFSVPCASSAPGWPLLSA